MNWNALITFKYLIYVNKVVLIDYLLECLEIINFLSLFDSKVRQRHLLVSLITRNKKRKQKKDYFVLDELEISNLGKSLIKERQIQDSQLLLNKNLHHPAFFFIWLGDADSQEPQTWRTMVKDKSFDHCFSFNQIQLNTGFSTWPEGQGGK